MNDLDRKIREALISEDAEFSPHTNEPSLVEQVIDTFRGRNRWLVVMVWLMVTVLMVVAVVSAYQFFEVEGQRAMIAWACSFGLSVTGIAMFKIWYWLELAKNAVLREVKRVELRVVRLGEGK